MPLYDKRFKNKGFVLIKCKQSRWTDDDDDAADEEGILSPLQVCVDSVERFGVAVRVLQRHPAGETELMLVEAQLLQRLLRGDQLQTLPPRKHPERTGRSDDAPEPKTVTDTTNCNISVTFSGTFFAFFQLKVKKKLEYRRGFWFNWKNDSAKLTLSFMISVPCMLRGLFGSGRGPETATVLDSEITTRITDCLSCKMNLQFSVWFIIENREII